MAQMIMPLPVKTERGMFMASEENVLMKQIVATHNPDGRAINVRPILHIVEDILNSATTTTPDDKVREAVEDKDKAEVTTMLEALSYIISRLSCEISYKCMGGLDGHSISVSLFNTLSSYSWDAKLVLTLAAFALTYGEFWLLAQIYSTNRLASRMAILKQLPVVTDHFAELKSRFEGHKNLIQSILDLSKCIVGFKELPSKYISEDNQVYSKAVAAIPLAVYWIFRSVIACATNITYLSGLGHEYSISTIEVWEHSSLIHKTKTMNEHLQKQLATCHQFIEERKDIEAYEALVYTFEAVHADNMKILRSLINPKAADIQPLLDGMRRRRVALDVLTRKTVLLLISGLDISQDELSILEQIYNESRMLTKRPESLYEMVWIPIVDHSIPWTDTIQRQFETLQSQMPWYSVCHPSLIDRAVIRFIKENLHFKRKVILVVLDQQGKMVSPNALHMMWIWGSNAFPFTSTREEALWREETWRLELVVDGIDPTPLNWIRDGKYIILYGSDDIEWIRKFTSAARAVAQNAHLPLEMVYVGKSTFKREQIRRANNVINAEKLSYQWEDPAMIWFFWTRLESMLFSKIELRGDDDKDPILHETKKLLSYDKTGPWALLSRGSQVILNGYGTTALSVLLEYDRWKEDGEEKGFDCALRDHYEMLHLQDHPCCRFEFETAVGRTPESMKCPDCRHSMQKFVTFSCCHD